MPSTRRGAAVPGAAVPGLAALALLVAGCGGGHTVKVGPAEHDCTAVVQAANSIVIIAGDKASEADIARSRSGADALTAAAAAATTPVAGPAGQLATAARSYADAVEKQDVEAINVGGGLLRQRAKPVADTCKQTVLGIAPSGAASGTEG